MLIFGNETDGLPEDVIAACSDVIEIPLSGVKESLNVSVAAGIVLFTPRQ
jgi:tRNA G18 (ribose-2'-O)-methylase SpoU